MAWSAKMKILGQKAQKFNVFLPQTYIIYRIQTKKRAARWFFCLTVAPLYCFPHY
jgi:hypothetical protein